MLLFELLSFAQTPPDTDTENGVTRSYPVQHNYGWLRVIGLVGLVGLRPRKSIDRERMEATGVNVKSVKV
jgi:predicted thioredoxin/glutaredoxin